MKLRRFLFWVLLAAAVGLACGCAGSGPRTEARPPIQVTVLFFNDLHGYLQPFVITTDKGKEAVGGIARMAALVKKILAENTGLPLRELMLEAIRSRGTVSAVIEGRIVRLP